MVKRIKHALINQELTITDLARSIGKSRVWTSQVINGHTKSPETLKRIYEALGINPELDDVLASAQNERESISAA